MIDTALEPLLRVSKVGKKHAGFFALSDISFELYPGEIMGVLGANGAGKTTLFKILANITKPDRGDIYLDGTPLKDNSNYAKQLGYLGEKAPLYEELSILDFLFFMVRLKGLSGWGRQKKQAEELVFSALERSGLLERKMQSISTLSKGLRQRLALGACLLGKPKLLLLDEPSSGLDPLQSIRMKEMIWEEKKRGCAILFSSHVVSEVESISDSVLIMRSGKAVCKLKRTKKKADFELDDKKGLVEIFSYLCKKKF